MTRTEFEQGLPFMYTGNNNVVLIKQHGLAPFKYNSSFHNLMAHTLQFDRERGLLIDRATNEGWEVQNVGNDKLIAFCRRYGRIPILFTECTLKID